MRDKKKTKSKKTPEQEALEKHVDAMMDPERADAADKPEPKIAAVAAPIADGPTTAPQLSAKLRKQVAITDAAKPLSIDKLDELTEQITESDTSRKSKKTDEKPEEPPAQLETAPEEDPTEQSTELDDDRTDEAVDDIVAYEGDVMLAVADSTAAERNRQLAAEKPKGHPVFSMLVWTLIAGVAILIVALCALLFMGDNLADKLGL